MTEKTYSDIVPRRNFMRLAAALGFGGLGGLIMGSAVAGSGTHAPTHYSDGSDPFTIADGKILKSQQMEADTFWPYSYLTSSFGSAASPFIEGNMETGKMNSIQSLFGGTNPLTVKSRLALGYNSDPASVSQITFRSALSRFRGHDGASAKSFAWTTDIPTVPTKLLNEKSWSGTAQAISATGDGQATINLADLTNVNELEIEYLIRVLGTANNMCNLMFDIHDPNENVLGPAGVTPDQFRVMYAQTGSGDQFTGTYFVRVKDQSPATGNYHLDIRTFVGWLSVLVLERRLVGITA